MKIVRFLAIQILFCFCCVAVEGKKGGHDKKHTATHSRKKRTNKKGFVSAKKRRARARRRRREWQIIAQKQELVEYFRVPPEKMSPEIVSEYELNSKRKASFFRMMVVIKEQEFRSNLDSAAAAELKSRVAALVEAEKKRHAEAMRTLSVVVREEKS